MLFRLLTLGAVAASLAGAADARERKPQLPLRVKSSCIGDRCALYVNNRRWGSVREESGRTVVRDKRGRVVAKIESRNE